MGVVGTVDPASDPLGLQVGSIDDYSDVARTTAELVQGSVVLRITLNYYEEIMKFC
jgi:hypothetical protein